MKYFFLLLICSTVFFCGYAQTNDNQQLHFNFIGVKEGLPEGTVKALLQDKYGYIWIGTQTGVVRFDGYTTKVYKTITGNGVPVYASVLYEDRLGRLWLGTSNDGFYLYNRNAYSFINYTPLFKKAETNSQYPVSAFQDDANGNLWLKLFNSELSVYNLAYFNTTTKQSAVYGKMKRGKIL